MCGDPMVDWVETVDYIFVACDDWQAYRAYVYVQRD